MIFFIKDVQGRPAPYDRCYRRLSKLLAGAMIFFQRSVLWSEENRDIWPVLWSIAEGVEVVRSGLWSTTFIRLEMVRSGLWSSSILSSCVHASACARVNNNTSYSTVIIPINHDSIIVISSTLNILLLVTAAHTPYPSSLFLSLYEDRPNLTNIKRSQLSVHP